MAHGSREVEAGDLSDPEVNDLLDDLAQLVLRMKSEVVVVPVERMPFERMPSHRVVATYRF